MCRVELVPVRKSSSNAAQECVSARREQKQQNTGRNNNNCDTHTGDRTGILPQGNQQGSLLRHSTEMEFGNRMFNINL